MGAIPGQDHDELASVLWALSTWRSDNSRGGPCSFEGDIAVRSECQRARTGIVGLS